MEWDVSPGLGRPRAGVECSAHLLPCGSGGQDVKLGELSRVFLGLEAQRGDTGGPAVCRGRGGGGGGRGRVGEDGASVGGVLYRRGWLTEEGCSGGSTGQRTHTGEEPERRRNFINLQHLWVLNLLIGLKSLSAKLHRSLIFNIKVCSYIREHVSSKEHLQNSSRRKNALPVN